MQQFKVVSYYFSRNNLEISFVSPKIINFCVFYPVKSDRYYRWGGRSYRPILSAVFTDIIGRYIGIGRTLPNLNGKMQISRRDEQ